jgi:5-methylcytosine-specific restriction endonuclease McrA
MAAYECECGVTGVKNFYKSAKYQCKSCWNKRTYKAGIDKLNKIKMSRGGKCEMCGYSKYLGALQWHHLDSSIKEYAIGHRRGLKETQLLQEISKCQLLCANCHSEVHAEF